MEKTPQSSSSSNAHLVDIHEVLSEEEEQGMKTGERAEKQGKMKQERKTTGNRSSFSRQVSLETGFSVLKGKQRNEGVALTRSGRSLGGIGAKSSNGAVGDVRKGNFGIFRTKQTLTKQNSLLPTMRKEVNNAVDYYNNNNNNNNINNVNNGNNNINNLNNNVNVNNANKNNNNNNNINQRINNKSNANNNNNNNNNNSNGSAEGEDSVPAGRYFAALRGPELDQVKEFENILLPKDEKWPFLLRFPIGCFGICLGLSSQAILWKSLSTSTAIKFLNVTPYINLVLWFLSLLILFLVCFIYMLKCIFYFEAVKREYFHPVRVNFFFAPWVVGMFMAIGLPPRISPEALHPVVFCVFAVPVFALELKIYGQWLSGGKRRLSMVANPSSHLSVVGNFVGAILAAKVGWKEPGKFLWAVGFAHYLVVFVTLYQRLPTSEALPKELHPVYCMFIATPAAASIAWEAIYGEFDGLSRTCFFIALFLYISLVVRPHFFTGFRFSVSWWSYTFPMTTASIATIKYAEQVPSVASKGLALSLSFMSSTMVAILLVSTLLHGFVWKTLFPNDLAIAITKKKQGKEHNNNNNNGNKKKTARKSYDIRRWTKQAPLSFVSAMTKSNKDES